MDDLSSAQRSSLRQGVRRQVSSFSRNAIDDAALLAAHRMAARQPRCDSTIVQLPLLGTPIGSDLVPIFHNGNTYAVQANVLAGVSPLAAPYFDVRTYGAKVDGTTDDTAAITAAIAAAAAAGGGDVLLGVGTSVISSTITVSSNYVNLIGHGKNASKLVMSTAGASAISFNGGGTIGSQIKNNRCGGFSLYQNNPTGAGIGLSLYYTAVARVFDMQISGFLIGVNYQRATNTITTDVIATFNTSTPIANAIGFNINGNPAASDGTVGGNQSSVWRDCGVDMSPASGGYVNVSPTSKGVYIYGAYCGDLEFFNINTSYSYAGIYITLASATPQSGANEDILITNPVCDFYTNQGIYINGISAATIDNLSMVTIIGGWFDPYTGGTPYGIQCNATRGVTILGSQFYTSTPATAPNQIGVYVVSSSNVNISGCNFTGQKNGIVTSNATDCQFTGNRFYNASGSSAVLMANITASTRVAVNNNVFDGYCTNYAIQIDATCVNCSALGNTINGTNMGTPLIFVATTATGSKVNGNQGYNPVGKFTSQPAVPATTVAYTNNLGPDATVFITAGASTVSVAIGGQTAYVIPASGVASVPVPAGQSITLTYASAPTWVWFGA